MVLTVNDSSLFKLKRKKVWCLFVYLSQAEILEVKFGAFCRLSKDLNESNLRVAINFAANEEVNGTWVELSNLSRLSSLGFWKRESNWRRWSLNLSTWKLHQMVIYQLQEKVSIVEVVFFCFSNSCNFNWLCHFYSCSSKFGVCFSAYTLAYLILLVKPYYLLHLSVDQVVTMSRCQDDNFFFLITKYLCHLAHTLTNSGTWS